MVYRCHRILQRSLLFEWKASIPNVGHAFAQCIYQAGSSASLEPFLHNRIASPLSRCTAFDEELLRGYLRSSCWLKTRCSALEWLIEHNK